MIRHTPGPWTADGRAICGNGTTLDLDGAMVAMVSPSNPNVRFTAGISKSEAQANISLITAAPKLLAACKLALAAFEHNHCIDWNELQVAIDEAERTA